MGGGARPRRLPRAGAPRLHLHRGLPQSELTDKPWTRWIVSTPERAAEAIYRAGIGRRPERYVPRAYALAAAARIVAPALVRRVLGGTAAAGMTTTTGADLAERRRNGYS